MARGARRRHDHCAPGWRCHRPRSHRSSQKGAKRSLLTGAAGIPIAIGGAGARRNAHKLARETLAGLLVARPAATKEGPQGLCLDKGYDYDEVRERAAEFGFTLHLRTRGEEIRALACEVGFRARRWVVERAHSWLNRFRRLLIRWEKRPETYLAMLHLACGIIAWRARLPGQAHMGVAHAHREVLSGPDPATGVRAAALHAVAALRRRPWCMCHAAQRIQPLMMKGDFPAAVWLLLRNTSPS